MSGRKPGSESRSAEIRQRLAEWKQMSKPQKCSLRVLARELRTSHQLLGHFLNNWEKWQAKESRRKAQEIRALMDGETRPWVVDEIERRAVACEAAAFRSTLAAALSSELRKLRRQAARGQLSAGGVKMLKMFASRGYGEAEEALRKFSRANKPRKIICHSAAPTSVSPLDGKGGSWQLR